MSMSIQRSKYTGDPGIFDFFKGVAKTAFGVAGLLPGVGPTIRELGGRIFPPAPGTTTYAQFPPMGRIPPMPQAGPGGVGGPPGLKYSSSCPPQLPFLNPSGSCVAGGGFAPRSLAPNGEPTPGFIGAMERLIPGGATGFEATTAMLAGKATGFPGYHWNKSGYFLMSGEYVAPGTKAVRNRRRNPANPRATSNAITRIKGAKRYAKSLSAITIRKHHHHSRH